MQSDATGLPRSASKARPRCERRTLWTKTSDSTSSAATSQKKLALVELQAEQQRLGELDAERTLR